MPSNRPSICTATPKIIAEQVHGTEIDINSGSPEALALQWLTTDADVYDCEEMTVSILPQLDCFTIRLSLYFRTNTVSILGAICAGRALL